MPPVQLFHVSTGTVAGAVPHVPSRLPLLPPFAPFARFVLSVRAMRARLRSCDDAVLHTSLELAQCLAHLLLSDGSPPPSWSSLGASGTRSPGQGCFNSSCSNSSCVRSVNLLTVMHKKQRHLVHGPQQTPPAALRRPSRSDHVTACSTNRHSQRTAFEHPRRANRRR